MWALSHIDTRSEAAALPSRRLAGQGRPYRPPCPSTTKYYVGSRVVNQRCTPGKKKPPRSISYVKSNYQGPIKPAGASWKDSGLDCWISFFRLAGVMPSPNGRSADSSRNHSTNVMAKNHGSDII